MTALFTICGILAAIIVFGFFLGCYIYAQAVACDRCQHKKKCNEAFKNSDHDYVPPCYRERMIRIDPRSDLYL